MKTTKRIISLIAAVAVLATMFVAVPVSAATEEVDILNWTFDNETGDTNWKSLSIWNNTTDGFYGAENRSGKDDVSKIVSGSTATYLQVGSSATNIEFKNIGVGQTEATASLATDTADKFGADSIFGTPYYVEFEFYVPTVNHVYSLFTQYFEGTLDGNNIISSGPQIQIRNTGYLAFADDESKIIANSTSATKATYQVTNSKWYTLKVYVDPAARTYQVWFDGTAVQKASETGTEPTAFKFGKVQNNGYSADEPSAAGSESMSDIGGTNINTYLANKNQVLAPNRTRFQPHGSDFRIDSLRMYRVVEVEGEDPVEPEEPAEPGIAVPAEGDVINWTFDSETTSTKWEALSIWSNTTDGFYGQKARYALGGVTEHTDASKTGNYYKLRQAAASTAQFRNVGVGQTESTVVDSAEYFGADSFFGKPYYVEFDFSVDAVAQVTQLFGQHFEGTLADGTTVYTSGPAIRVTSAGYMQFADGFASDTAVSASNITAQTGTVKNEIKPAANTWYHLKIYVNPVARTYQVWFDGTAVQLASETGTEPTVFEFGAVQNNTGSDVDAGAGSTSAMLIGGYNPNKYLKDAGIVLAPNRTRFQTAGAGLNIDDLHIYYPPQRYTIASELIAAFNAANNNGAIAEGTKKITLPTLPEKYDSSKYTVSWSTDNARINTTTGAVSNGIVSDAVLTVTVTEAAGTATATTKASLPFNFTSWVENPVDFEIGGVLFMDAGVEEVSDDDYIFAPVPGGKLVSVQFTNNLGYSGNLIAAVYDADGRLAACKVIGDPSDGVVEVDLDIPATATNPEVKFFMWSADDGITPLTTSAQAYEEAGRKLFIISDSRFATTTMGEVLAEKFNTTNLPIVDLSVVGTTLKRFATEEVSGETRLQAALGQIQPGDYVMLSFGFTDRYDATWGETTSGTIYDVGSYSYFYQKYVEAIRLAGGVPILVTPAPTGNFNVQNTPLSALSLWISNVRQLGYDYDLPFVNLHVYAKSDHPTMSLQQLGPDGSAAYYQEDLELLTDAGAEWIGDLFVELVEDFKLPFAKYAK